MYKLKYMSSADYRRHVQRSDPKDKYMHTCYMNKRCVCVRLVLCHFNTANFKVLFDHKQVAVFHQSLLKGGRLRNPHRLENKTKNT